MFLTGSLLSIPAQAGTPSPAQKIEPWREPVPCRMYIRSDSTVTCSLFVNKRLAEFLGGGGGRINTRIVAGRINWGVR